MNDSSASNNLFPDDSNRNENQDQPSQTTRGLTDLWENLVRHGLGEAVLRIGTGLASLALVLLVVWVMSSFYLKGKVTINDSASVAIAASLPTATPTIAPPQLAPLDTSATVRGITRLAQLRTLLPTRPRFEITTYVVQQGDTIFGIAEKFNLNPATILWGNQETLGDNPHFLSPGQELNILPMDGVLYRWHKGDGLNKVAEVFDVDPQTIVDWPGNNLDPETIGDYALPNIPEGTLIFAPGGTREFVTWSAPFITRDNPAQARISGPGYCGTVYTGAVGNGTFIWPSTETWLSGYDWSPETNHWGIDVAGRLGYPIYAVDNGVVVYSGWNDWGYGNVVVIDHGNGFQSLYAHLNTINTICGQSVYQGDIIGGMGSTGRSTGPHLHFELRSGSSFVNPWNYLMH
ncbi:MAG TPA: M23 family metallopeptidase [Anaerolineaceae bacterium]|nr:M23 family metallopeptidase [Longilinea sp.]HNZ00868.1 M23 family metallopeptidase [Anaerolineaceae bacterium]HOH19317.1 M23 family metallopeptidase [Anaerolineaceae bacterium]HQO96144.1 M23 family metallopeptidase [Anaerolineaceae bacterium]HQP60552.1 M23 family metallopeptidase [Anaerolineaceae bacterium]